MSLLEQLSEIRECPTNNKYFTDLMWDFVLDTKYFSDGQFTYSDDIIDLKFVIKLIGGDPEYIVGYIANKSIIVVVINWMGDDIYHHYVLSRDKNPNIDGIFRADGGFVKYVMDELSSYSPTKDDGILISQFLPSVVKSARNS